LTDQTAKKLQLYLVGGPARSAFLSFALAALVVLFLLLLGHAYALFLQLVEKETQFNMMPPELAQNSTKENSNQARGDIDEKNINVNDHTFFSSASRRLFSSSRRFRSSSSLAS
jgi:sensor histidine kinase regulating citrate/malate metabolism